MWKVAIIAADNNLKEFLKTILSNDGFKVYVGTNGRYGLELVKCEQPDIVILNVTLSGELNGYDVCHEIRKFSNVPIIILSKKATEAEKIIGFTLGANDYLTEPFSYPELIARVKSNIKQVERIKNTFKEKMYELKIGNISINKDEYKVTIEDEELNLRHKEFEILNLFAENFNKVMTRDKILDYVWGIDSYGEDRLVDVNICRLREALNKSKKCNVIIKSVRSIGYKCCLKDSINPHILKENQANSLLVSIN